MRRRFVTMVLASMVVAIGLCIPAWASIEVVDDPIPGESEGQAFRVHGAVPIWTLGATGLTSSPGGVAFEDKAIRNISVTPEKWTTYYGATPASTWFSITKTGAAVYDVTFELWFTDGTKSTTFLNDRDVSFTFLDGVYSATKPYDYELVSWNHEAKQWTIKEQDPSCKEALEAWNAMGGSSPLYTPEPGALVIWSLLGGLAIGLGWWRKRRG